MLTALELKLENYQGLITSLISNLKEWKLYAASSEPYKAPLPENWDQKFDDFNRLLLVRALRPDKLLLAFTEYIHRSIGEFFT